MTRVRSGGEGIQRCEQASEFSYRLALRQPELAATSAGELKQMLDRLEVNPSANRKCLIQTLQAKSDENTRALIAAKARYKAAFGSDWGQAARTMTAPIR